MAFVPPDIARRRFLGDAGRLIHPGGVDESMKLLTSAQMREFEQRADAGGNSYGTMMERAGKAVADAITARRDVSAKSVLVLVGPGNNGGDGLVCARYLHDAGARVALYVWKRELRDDDENLQLCLVRNVQLYRAEEDVDYFELQRQIEESAVLVDALLGTGVARPIEGALKDILGVIKSNLASATISQSPFIAAVDLPSGLNPDTGMIDPAALYANLTVTFAFPKMGQFIFPGAESVGELVVADIGIHEEWASEIKTEVAEAKEVAGRLPARPRDSHKGTFGKALLCAGSLNYTGAAYLCAMAAARAGAGLVTLALARTIYPIVASSAHESTFLPLPDANGMLIPSAARTLKKNLDGYDAFLIGPGLGRNAKTVEFVGDVMKAALPLLARVEGGGIVIDADALYALALSGEWWKRITPNRLILTPHPGEMATLCGMSRDEIQGDRIAVARKFAKEWQQVVVLKGAYSIVASPLDRVTIVPFATPALATGGTGDVLAGTITAMLAQGLSTYDAAVVGAYVHGLAGKIAEAEIGRAGVVAGDLLPRLPQALRQLNP